MPRLRFAAIAALVLSGSIAACSPSPGTGAASGGGTPAKGCRSGDPLANVYHPYRLHVVATCRIVTGTVVRVREEDDGDVHINLSLPASEAGLLDTANRSYEEGDLVAEIVPADEPGCTSGQPPPLPPSAYTSPSYDYGTCTGAAIAVPSVGEDVAITGPYVLDADHGWMEIHPVWSIAVRGSPGSAPQTPPAAPSPTVARGAAWCTATAAPANDGYAADYDVTVRSNQPEQRATASDAGDTWSAGTDSSGAATIRLYHTSPGMAIRVSAGAATCSTTA